MGEIFSGIHPAEWIIPAVGMSHAMYNVPAGAASKDARVMTPDSSGANAERDAEEAARLQAEQQAAQDAAAKQAEQERQQLMPRPQTPQEEAASRKRAIAAYELLGGSRRRRASQTLTEQQTTLAGVGMERR
ncbi:MAG: hypothetical protein OEV08_00855 [Nitrospira sp.]|nr:hypothetical protein [Nitrospira sp.]